MIDMLEEQVRLRLAESTSAKPQATASATHKGATVWVSARQLTHGKLIFKYWFDGIRLERSLLLQLVCTETDCPQCQQTQTNWRLFRGMPAPAPRGVKPSFGFRHLVEEFPIDVAGRTCVARPAVLQCRIICPVRAHAPAVVRKTGWDLFEGSKYLTGGLVTNPETLAQEPALPTIDAAKNWLAHATH